MVSHNQIKEKLSVRTVIISGLIVGTLDITAASIQTLIYGRSPLQMLKFIASGVFAKTALEGGILYAFCGLLFHYCIAMGWTILFFFLYQRIKFLSMNIFLTGLLYGCFVWLMMSQVVLPLSNITPFPFVLSRALVAMSILVVAIGLPLSYMASRYYKNSDKF